MAKTYGQFCALARALDHVGDRWTLLVIRELLIKDSSYGELCSALGGIPTNLLAGRLRDLEEDGLVIKETSHEDRRRVTYRLTPLGRGLEPVILTLIVWGAHWMLSGPGSDRFTPRWALLALQALLSDRGPKPCGTVELRIDGDALRVVSTGDANLGIERRSSASEPDAIVDGDAVLLIGLVSGQLSFAAAIGRGVRVRGDRSLASAVLQP